MRRLITGFILFFLAAAIMPVQAQTQGGVAVSPPSFDLKANPSESIENSIKVENLTNSPVTLDVFAQNFTAFGEGGQIALTEEDSTFSLIDWIEFPETTLTVAPKSTEIFTFTIRIPKKAEPGSHYGAVVFRAQEKGPKNESGANITAQIGSLILLRLPGRVYENARINTFTTAKQFYTDNAIQFNASIENTGNVHVKPYGFITIKNLFGWTEKTYEVRGRNILPGSKRLFDEQITMDGVGIHTAELTLLYSEGGGVMKKETRFITLPLKTVVPILIGLVIITIVYILFRKRITKALAVLVKGE